MSMDVYSIPSGCQTVNIFRGFDMANIAASRRITIDDNEMLSEGLRQFCLA
jgi:hypothetical protein